MTAHAFASLDGFLAADRPARKNELGQDDMRRARAKVEEMLQTGDWSEASGRHHVALFMFLHERVYGVRAAEMTPRACFQAAGEAARLQKQAFDNDPAALATFVLWTWKREGEREKWRRQNGRQGGRVSARLQFGTFMLGDYAVDAKRQAEGRK